MQSTRAIRDSRRTLALGLLAITVAGLVAYVPALRAGFIWDDDAWVHVGENDTLADVDGLWRIWFEPGATQQYYPVSFTDFWFEYRLWGLEHPWGYHLGNVLIHAATAVLFWLCLERLGFRRIAAWAAGMLFVLHPIHVESVAWITERKNVLSGALFMGALLAYLVYCRLDLGDEPERRRRGLWLAALLLFTASLLAKVVTVALPPTILLLVWWKRRSLVREIRPLLPFFAVAVAVGLVVLWMEKTHIGASGAEWDLTLVERLLLAGRVPWFYAGKLLLPVNLTFVYPRWTLDATQLSQLLFPVATLGAVAGLWFARARLGRGPLVAVLYYLGSIAPVMGFLDVYFFRFSWVADRYPYIASAGLIALTVGFVDRALATRPLAWRKAVIAATAAVVLVFGILTWNQSRAYHDYRTIWLDTLEKNPDSWLAHNNLGLYHAERGNEGEAASRFAEALRLKPDDPTILMNAGRSLSRLGRHDEAESAFAGALRHGPDKPMVHVNYAAHLMQTGRPGEAVARYEAALELRPRADWALELGLLLTRLERTGEAHERFREAVELEPGNARANFLLARSFQLRGERDAAVERYARAVEADPAMADAHLQLGMLLAATDPGERAATHLRAAARLRPDHVELSLLVARGLVRSGYRADAIAILERSASAAPDRADVRAALEQLRSGAGTPGLEP